MLSNCGGSSPCFKENRSISEKAMPSDSSSMPLPLREDLAGVARPLPDAADAVAEAAAAVKADAELAAAMLQEIRGSWLWALLVKQGPL